MADARCELHFAGMSSSLTTRTTSRTGKTHSSGAGNTFCSWPQFGSEIPHRQQSTVDRTAARRQSAAKYTEVQLRCPTISHTETVHPLQPCYTSAPCAHRPRSRDSRHRTLPALKQLPRSASAQRSEHAIVHAAAAPAPTCRTPLSHKCGHAGAPTTHEPDPSATVPRLHSHPLAAQVACTPCERRTPASCTSSAVRPPALTPLGTHACSRQSSRSQLGSQLDLDDFDKCQDPSLVSKAALGACVQCCVDRRPPLAALAGAGSLAL